MVGGHQHVPVPILQRVTTRNLYKRVLPWLLCRASSMYVEYVEYSAPATFRWQVRSARKETISNGVHPLVKQHDGTWSLRFKSTGANLLAMGTQVVVTRERNNQPTTTPSSDVALQGMLPPTVFAQVTALLVTFPSTPGQHGLQVGLLGQARLVNEQAQLLNISLQHNAALPARCTAQGLLDVVEGTHGPNYRPLSQECQSLHINQVGDGFGILSASPKGYLAGVLTHAALASHTSDATPAIKAQAAHLTVASENVRTWYQKVDEDASIDPVKNEAGVVQGYAYAQSLATFPLVPRP